MNWYVEHAGAVYGSRHAPGRSGRVFTVGNHTPRPHTHSSLGRVFTVGNHILPPHTHSHAIDQVVLHEGSRGC